VERCNLRAAQAAVDRSVCSLPCHFPRVAGSAVTTADIEQAACSSPYAVKIELLKLTLTELNCHLTVEYNELNSRTISAIRLRKWENFF